MSVEVVMPQMGESIAEGTITKWLKNVGERVERDEPLFEISTDKVDAEIPSPAAGVLKEVLHKEGETVEVNKVVAILDDGSGNGASGSSSAASTESEAKAEPTPTPEPQADGNVKPPQPEASQVTEEKKEVPAPAQVAQESASPATSSSSGATVDIVMPQMGESIAEGTITKWLKKVGDKVERDEPLFEISTDKVDAEIPSPAAGTLVEIKNGEGETVEVGKVVALLGSGDGAATASTPSAPTPTPTPVEEKKTETPQPVVQAQQTQQATPQAQVSNKPISEQSVDELRRTRSSPLVRNIAKEHGIDLSRLTGTGASGRVTKNDIMSFIESGAALSPQQALATAQTGAALPATATPATTAQVSAPPVAAKAEAPKPQPTITPSVGDRVEQMSVIRKKIAEHMTFSKQTSAHVTTVYEIDMTGVVKLREKSKKDFVARYGTKLSYMPFIFQAVTQAIRKFPIVNVQVSGDQIIYKGDINLGMAVALDWGLIVPVIKRADQLSISGLALTANDLADRARAKKLKPDEVAGGTFTITNPGVFGGLFGTPIINQPQVAILGVGTIEKRPKVITTDDGDDVIAIRSMAYFALTFDHRIIDGADAERFLSYLKEVLEAAQFSI